MLYAAWLCAQGEDRTAGAPSDGRDASLEVNYTPFNSHINRHGRRSITKVKQGERIKILQNCITKGNTLEYRVIMEDVTT